MSSKLTAGVQTGNDLNSDNIENDSKKCFGIVWPIATHDMALSYSNFLKYEAFISDPLFCSNKQQQ